MGTAPGLAARRVLRWHRAPKPYPAVPATTSYNDSRDRAFELAFMLSQVGITQ